MTPDPDGILVYDYFRREHGWPPSVVDEQDAVLIEKFLIMENHRAVLRKAGRNV